MHCCATKSARCPDALTITILCIGYGAYHACCYNGIVRGAFLARIGLDTDETWLCLLLLVCATGVGCLAVRALHKHWVHVTGPAGTASSYASIALFALLGLLFDSSAEVSYLLSFATGLASSIPLLVWFKSFLALYLHARDFRRYAAQLYTDVFCGPGANGIAPDRPFDWRHFGCRRRSTDVSPNMQRHPCASRRPRRPRGRALSSLGLYRQSRLKLRRCHKPCEWDGLFLGRVSIWVVLLDARSHHPLRLRSPHGPVPSSEQRRHPALRALYQNRPRCRRCSVCFCPSPSRLCAKRSCRLMPSGCNHPGRCYDVAFSGNMS